MISNFKNSNKEHVSLESSGEAVARGELSFFNLKSRADSDRPIFSSVYTIAENVEYGLLYCDKSSKKRGLDIVHDELFTKWGYIQNSINKFNSNVDELEAKKKNKKDRRYMFIKDKAFKKYEQGSVKTEEEFINFVKTFINLHHTLYPTFEIKKQEDIARRVVTPRKKAFTWILIATLVVGSFFIFPTLKFFIDLFS